MEVVNALGRRKRAIARIFVSEGTGKITINKRDLAEYFPSTILQYVVKQPLNKLGGTVMSAPGMPMLTTLRIIGAFHTNPVGPSCTS